MIATPEYPLHLIAQAAIESMNSQILEAEQDELLTAVVSPAAAVQAGLADGERAVVASPRGRLEVRVRIDPTLRPDTLVLPKGGWQKHRRNMNVLVEPRYTAGTGVAFNQNTVRLERL